MWSKNNPFYDKKEPTFLKFSTDGEMLEIFRHKKKKCKIIIPETAAFLNGNSPSSNNSNPLRPYRDLGFQ